jgi:hypothetical protein
MDSPENPEVALKEHRGVPKRFTQELECDPIRVTLVLRTRVFERM